MINNTDIHNGLDRKDLRDFIGSSLRNLFQNEVDCKQEKVPHHLPSLEWRIKKIEAEIKYSQQQLDFCKSKLALREIMKMFGWDEFDVSEYSSRGPEKYWMSFIGTEQERDAFTEKHEINY